MLELGLQLRGEGTKIAFYDLDRIPTLPGADAAPAHKEAVSLVKILYLLAAVMVAQELTAPVRRLFLSLDDADVHRS